MTERLDTGDRVYATEEIIYGVIDRAVRPGDEGTVERFSDHDGCPLVIEWDAGFVAAAAAESLAPVPPLAR